MDPPFSIRDTKWRTALRASLEHVERRRSVNCPHQDFFLSFFFLLSSFHSFFLSFFFVFLFSLFFLFSCFIWFLSSFFSIYLFPFFSFLFLPLLLLLCCTVCINFLLKIWNLYFKCASYHWTRPEGTEREKNTRVERQHAGNNAVQPDNQQHNAQMQTHNSEYPVILAGR